MQLINQPIKNKLMIYFHCRVICYFHCKIRLKQLYISNEIDKGWCGVNVLRNLKEELVWAIDKQFWLISIVLLLKTLMPLTNYGKNHFKGTLYSKVCMWILSRQLLKHP